MTSFGRLLAALCLAGSFVLVASGSASAAAPNWEMTAVPVPDTVHNGSAVAYRVTITNRGPSNISSLYLQTSRADVPVYLVNDDSHAACASGTTARLYCAFGALLPGDPVTITVGYATPASGASFNPGFLANTTGASPNDKKNASHGDSLSPVNDPTTDLRSDKNFAGGFALTISGVGTDTTLGKNNVQSTSVTPPQAHVPVTTEDGLKEINSQNTFNCPASYCGSKSPFGEWSKVNVDDGAQQSAFFPITIMIYGKSVPTSVSIGDIALIHTDDSGNVIGTGPLTQCAPDAPLQNCLQVSKVGSNYKIVAWVDRNGGFKGMG